MRPEMIIFLPIILFFGFFFLLVAGFLFVVFKLIMKGKNMAWKGTLKDKKYVQKDVDDDGFHKTEHFYTLIFETEEGKQIKLGVARGVYDQWNIGDKGEKKKGEIWPKKIE